MTRKAVDTESLPLIMSSVLGIPKSAISLHEDTQRQVTGVRITNKSGQTCTF